MWKTITDKTEIKNYPLGTKVRVNGIETEIIKHYEVDDFGFHTEHRLFHWDKHCKEGLFANPDWEDSSNTVEVWQED